MIVSGEFGPENTGFLSGGHGYNEVFFLNGDQQH